jgi:hypothetical protein
MQKSNAGSAAGTHPTPTSLPRHITLMRLSQNPYTLSLVNLTLVCLSLSSAAGASR